MELWKTWSVRSFLLSCAEPLRKSTQAAQGTAMRVRPNEFCPIHRSTSCCGRELMFRPRLIRLGVQRFEDPERGCWFAFAICKRQLPRVLSSPRHRRVCVFLHESDLEHRRSVSTPLLCEAFVSRFVMRNWHLPPSRRILADRCNRW
jgi:hypothetical protein